MKGLKDTKAPHRRAQIVAFVALRSREAARADRRAKIIACGADEIIRRARSWPRKIGKRFRVRGGGRVSTRSRHLFHRHPEIVSGTMDGSFIQSGAGPERRPWIDWRRTRLNSRLHCETHM